MKGDEGAYPKGKEVEAVPVSMEEPSAPELPIAHAVPVSTATVSSATTEKPTQSSAMATTKMSGYGTTESNVNVVTGVAQEQQGESVMLMRPRADHTRPAGCCGPKFTVKNVLKDYLYLVGVTINASVSSVVLLLTSVLGVATLPLCCLGVVFINLAFRMMATFGRFDVQLYNFIALESERIQLSMKQHMHASELRTHRGYMLSPDVGTASCKSLGGMIYFIIILPSLAFTALLISSVVTISGISVVLAGAGLIETDGCLVYEDFECMVPYESASWNTFFCGLVLTVLAVWLTRALTRFFMWLTKMVLAEYYTTFVYAPVGSTSMRMV